MTKGIVGGAWCGRAVGIICLGAAALVVGALYRAGASDYPTRPIRFVIPFSAGGIADIHSRIIGAELSKRLGQEVFIDNQPGGYGIAAARTVLSAPADGYTITLLANGTATSVWLTNLPFDPVNDFVPISNVVTFDHLIAASAKSKYRSLQDAIEAARAKPGSLNIGTSAAGTTGNLVGHLFVQRAGIEATLMPHRKTGELAIGLLRGDLDLIVHTYAAIAPVLKDGSVRALASTGAQRSALLPDVPTAEEAGLSFEAASWNGIFARAGTPQSVAARLNREINAALAEDHVKKRLLDAGIEPLGGTPGELHARFKQDIERWGVVIKKAGIEKQ